MLVRRIGEDTLRAEAVEDLVQPVFEEALEQEGVDLYAQPSLENIELHPVTFKFIVPLSPTVVLGDYRAIRQDVEDVQVTDEALTEALEYVRMRHQSSSRLSARPKRETWSPSAAAASSPPPNRRPRRRGGH